MPMPGRLAVSLISGGQKTAIAQCQHRRARAARDADNPDSAAITRAGLTL